MNTIRLPDRWPAHAGYALKVSRTENGEGLDVTVTFPPKPTVSTRRKFRMARYLRLVIAAGVKAGREFVGAENTSEVADALREAVLKALNTAGARYRHLKT